MEQKEIFDIAIVGGGPSGMTAMLYALRAGKRAILFEKYCLGGQIINSYELANYPAIGVVSGVEFTSGLEKQIREYSNNIVFGEVKDIIKKDNTFCVKTLDKEYNSKTIILALGNKDRLLNIQGESEFTGRGVSYCAVCDGMFFKNKKVAIIGGGNTAIEYVRYMYPLAQKIYLINKNDIIKGEKSQIEYVMNLVDDNKLIYLKNTLIKSISGNNVVENIEVLDKNTNNTNQIKVDGVLVAIGRDSANTFFANELKQDKNGYIITDQEMKTNIDGVFACGDVRQKMLKQVITACSDGAIATTSAIKYLDKL